MIIIVRNFGQLGNRLLLSAHLIAAAREYGVTLLNPSFAEYAQYFPATAHDMWCRYPVCNTPGRSPSKLARSVTYQAVYLTGKSLWHASRIGLPIPMIRLVGDASCDLESDEFRERAESSTPLLVSGWQFRSATLLQKHADAIRQHYQILPEHRSRVTTLMHRVRRDSDVVVGVHIRHGDYASFQNGKYFYTIQQYVAAMRRVRQHFEDRDVTFLVCGNANLDREDFGGLNVHFGTGHLIEDMYAFAETDLLIGPPSTYTGWASFYGDTPLHFLETADQEFDFSSTSNSPKRAAA